MLARRKNKGKFLCKELLKAKNSAEVESIWIPSAIKGQSNTNVKFTSYAPVPPFMLKKIMEYNSSTYQEIALSFVNVLKSFEPTQAEIATPTYASATTAPESQEEQAGEHKKIISSRYSESRPYYTGRSGRKWARRNPSNSPDIILWSPYPILDESIPRTGTSGKIELKSIMEGSSLETIAL